MRADQIMTSPVTTVWPDTSLQDVAGLFIERGIGAAPVVDGLGRLLGIVTEADLLRAELTPDPRRHARRDAPDPPPVPETAGEAMSSPVAAVPPDTDVADVARLMIDDHLTRIPVVAGGRLVGIVSRTDLLRVVARTDEQIRIDIDHLLADAATDPRWQVAVWQGSATVRGGPDGETGLVSDLLRTVPGVSRITVRPGTAHTRQPTRSATP